MEVEKICLNWSSGKDAALALHYLLQQDQVRPGPLLTTVNSHFGRVSMHGLRTTLLERQLESIGIPSVKLLLPESPDNALYEQLMLEQLRVLKAGGINQVASGDLFLSDVRDYRERLLARAGLKGSYPLWGRDTTRLIDEFLDLGFKAVVICGNSDLLDPSFAGRLIDRDFVRDLPDGVDPCGENGEFHTFCFDGPYFSRPVDFVTGRTVTREYRYEGGSSRFWFCDLEETESV